MRHMRHLIEYFMLFVLNGIMLWYFRGYLNLLIAVAMIVFFLYAVISVHIVKKYVSMKMEAPTEYITKNTEFFVKIRLRNESYLPLVKVRIFLRTGNSFLGEMSQNVLVAPLKPHGTAEILYPLTSVYVGNVEVQAEKIQLNDLLGFHTVTIKIKEEENVYVVPAGSEEEKFNLNDYERGMDEVEESKLAGSDFSDVSQVREYIPGDAMKNIHWKLSAKKDLLMVKERLHMSSRKLLVVLALDKKNVSKADATIERLYSFGLFFINNRVPVTLFWWSERYHEMRQETAESAEGWMRLMIQLLHNRAGNEFVEEQFRSSYPGKGYVLVENEQIVAVD